MTLIRTLALILFLPVATWAQSVPEADIRGTIQSQIDAFLADDFGTAFTFASPGIQNMFRTPENFGAMVRNGYPMVWRPSDVRFLELREINGVLWQKVMVRDADGGTHILDYKMEQGDEGWRIDGVQVIPAPQVSA